ncbi:Metallo-hydrolase/oxidoreductase [Sistotremastrum niveocremeum HHB9708]|uniref:Endoribonuclease YSH1 n=1 Tax=Sistotremastrum niveocremeum HHB9708 TaxID=1314777 RepID=A0A165A372_9AGAM|nr:Metallo-hydrolase/oxidoreductase [Sistotremastrum niveocremeum HHB9708]
MSDSPVLSVTLLGAGQEVGRSCCVLQYRGITVVCDAGVHPAYSGMASLPFIDELDWSTVDAILITHFHLDHAASLTYIMEKTNFKSGKGKVYMTHPTKAVYKFLMQDFARMSAASTDPLFTPLDLSLSFSAIIPISVHQQITPSPGLSFTPYHAGHVLGACMFLIDIAGLKILYTGDYSREEDRHLVKAELPPVRPDVLIVESTYGVQSLGSREEKELRFTGLVHSIIKRGGHVLLPVFALGRAQELLLILEEHWKKHPELHNVPVYYASSLARKCMAVYQTYIHTMNSNIRSKFAQRENPFVFKHISHLPLTRGWERKISEGPPCVVLASPGVLQNGPSRELLELWAPDSRNGLIITGYSVEGTLARDIVNEPAEIISLKGNTIPLRMSVDEISFSAHVDYSQNSAYIEMVKAQHVVLVHGEQSAMGRLRAAMQHRYKERDEDVKIHTPRNLETLKLSFRGERVAKAIGSLAASLPQPGTILSGLLVSKDYSYTLLNPRDLKDFAGLSTSSVIQRQKVHVGVGWELIRWHLEGMYGTVEIGLDPEDKQATMQIMDAITIKDIGSNQLLMEWESNASNDVVADSALALIMGIDKSPASVKLTSHHDKHHPHSDAASTSSDDNTRHICAFLEAHFSDVKWPIDDTDMLDLDVDLGSTQSPILVRLDQSVALVQPETLSVTSSNEALRRRLDRVLKMASITTGSLSQLYSASGHSDLHTIKNTPEDGEAHLLKVLPEPVSAPAEADDPWAKEESGQEKWGKDGYPEDEEDDDSVLEVHG